MVYLYWLIIIVASALKMYKRVIRKERERERDRRTKE
jgi:hypothetical protein